MIPPHELKNKEFTRVMRGYAIPEVDEYISFVMEKYTDLYRENDALERKLQSAMDVHVFPILNPPPISLPIPSLWVLPVHQLQASCILYQTWTGKPERKTPIQYTNAYIWNLERW